MCLPYGPFPYLPVSPRYCVESSESQKIKLDNDLISRSLKSNCDIIICTSVYHFLMILNRNMLFNCSAFLLSSVVGMSSKRWRHSCSVPIGCSKAGSTNETGRNILIEQPFTDIRQNFSRKLCK